MARSKKLAQLHQQAICALEPLGESAQPLRDLADFIVERRN